jgi:hypothetical protein
MRRLLVETAGTTPVAMDLGCGFVRVAGPVAHWVVEVGWWRTPPARWERRDCWRLLLEDGRCLDVYQSGADRSWHLRKLWG